MDMLDSIAQKMWHDVRRHAVLAGNIANAQTPGYMPKDVTSSSFGAALDMATTHSGHLRGSSGMGSSAVTVRPGSSSSSLDGNGVDLDEERGLIAENALDLEAQMRFATHYLRQWQTAVS